MVNSVENGYGRADECECVNDLKRIHYNDFFIIYTHIHIYYTHIRKHFPNVRIWSGANSFAQGFALANLLAP